ncbi:endonuclease NucS [Candidatus Woesearchaeota archaeon]|nr:MAG: hypothetical protein QT09_C0012G0086 [archaeon GW2011_AR18]MBS3161722.1 endonuclease NucS [Candidatus Woesearchaeota archaeon]
MDLQKFVINFANSYRKKEFIVFSAECEVTYSGKTETKLNIGDRVILLKPDGSLQVHQPTGNVPINYVKEGTDHSIDILDGTRAIIKSHNIPQGDYMQIIIHTLHFFNSHKTEDGHKIQLTGTEKDMSDMIYENPTLVEKGLHSVKQEEQTNYGFIDVLCRDENNNLVVIECKRVKADFTAVSQLRRYIDRVKETKGITNIRGILVAPGITTNAEQMLNDYGYKFVAIDPPRYLEKLKKSQKSLGEF